VEQHIADEIDKKLAEKGLSIEQLKRDVAVNDSSGNVSVAQTFKEVAKDSALIEANRLVQAKLAEYQQQIATKGELDSTSEKIWYRILTGLGGLLSLYLGKQVVTQGRAASHGARIDALEKIFDIIQPTPVALAPPPTNEVKKPA